MGAILQVQWPKVVGFALLIGWFVEYSLFLALRKRWYELLDAIRGRQSSGNE